MKVLCPHMSNHRLYCINTTADVKLYSSIPVLCYIYMLDIDTDVRLQVAILKDLVFMFLCVSPLTLK